MKISNYLKRSTSRVLRAGRVIALAGSAAAALTVAGCAVLGAGSEYAIYAPQPHFAAPAGKTLVEWQLQVQEPYAGETISAPNLLVMPTPAVYEVFPAARWRDPPPMLVGTLLLQAFEQSGRIVGVDRAASGVNTDFVLTSELRDFQIEIIGAAPRAKVTLHVRLLGFADNRIVAARTFEATAPAAAQDSASGAQAIESALATLLPQVRDWTFDAANQAWRQRVSIAPPGHE
ncbi:MAG: ABC-type transport auxiliary lipoprotein family protein [Dokdonella sp.]